MTKKRKEPSYSQMKPSTGGAELALLVWGALHSLLSWRNKTKGLGQRQGDLVLEKSTSHPDIAILTPEHPPWQWSLRPHLKVYSEAGFNASLGSLQHKTHPSELSLSLSLLSVTLD